MRLVGSGPTLLAVLLGISCGLTAQEKVCQGISNQLTLLGGYDIHYNNLVKMYSNCTVVLENLEITYIQEHRDLSFLSSVREVGGYVLIAINMVLTIPLANLRLIRGHTLYNGQYALAVIIQWWDIVDKSTNPSMLFTNQTYPRTCKRCHANCNGSCWTDGQQHCQTVTKLLCADQCPGRCLGTEPNDCCNKHCAAGCTGPRDTQCLVCKAFNDDGVCKANCPRLMIYDPASYQQAPNPNAKFSFGSTCVKSCPRKAAIPIPPFLYLERGK
ncbi:hypothetical protein NHX12_021701 [Muraenolepis orangiensis]|uniref:receptor protein-tyrosine kinase n=1 Tax=Muraenolepis orangiensis TaxID=630683 RepID=A0A9Q0EW80_9TELE|nr:hypothetical protein NHX12_021701 [Muraenolepis orangiensis]